MRVVLDLRRSARTLGAAGAILAASLAIAGPAQAALRYVDDTGGADGANTCLTKGSPCLTVNHAVVQAAAGDTIKVADGSYAELVAVNKRVHLEGAQAGIDARGRTGAETVMNGSQGAFNVTADGASVDGFTMRDQTNGGFLGYGIALSGGASGYSVVNNIIRDNIAGMYLNSDGQDQTLVRRNAFISNNQPGPVSGSGIYGDSALGDVVIDENSFTGHTNTAINLGHPRSTDVVITNNQLTNDRHILLWNVNNGLVEGNTNTGSTASGITLGGGNVGIDIVGNHFTGAPNGPGVSVADFGFPSDGPNRNVNVVGNTLTGNARGIRVSTNAMSDSLDASLNRIVGNTTVGVENVAGNTVPITAENNWFGCNEGPGQAGCDTVTGTLDASPHLAFTAAEESSRVLTGGDSTFVDAGFVTNSDGGSVDSADFPATPIGFTSTLGTVTDATDSTFEGLADTLFVAGATPGTGTVTASVDNETATASFDVSAQAGPTGATGPQGDTVGTGAAGANGSNGATGSTGSTGAPGAPGAQGLPGQSTPAGEAEATPIAISTTTLRASSSRVLSVRLSCPTGAGICDGRLTLKAGRTTVGRGTFLIQGGRNATVRVKLSRRSLAVANRRTRLRVDVFSRNQGGDASQATANLAYRR